MTVNPNNLSPAGEQPDTVDGQNIGRLALDEVIAWGMPKPGEEIPNLFSKEQKALGYPLYGQLLSAAEGESVKDYAAENSIAGYTIYRQRSELFGLLEVESMPPAILKAILGRQLLVVPVPKTKAAPELTSTELKVLALIARGLTDKEINEHINDKARTTVQSIATLQAKLDAGPRPQIVYKAFEKRVIPLPNAA